MSKLDNEVLQYVQRLTNDYGIDMNDVKFRGVSIEEAVVQHLIQPSLVLMMQHVGFALGVKTTQYIVTEQWYDDESMLVVNEWDELTTEQMNVVNEYYTTAHKKLNSANSEVTAFLLFCAVKGALFIGKETVDRELIYCDNILTLNHSVVVLDFMRTTMQSLVRPNQTIHVNVTSQPTLPSSAEPELSEAIDEIEI